MTQSRNATGAAQRVGTGVGRVMAVWRVLPYERRLAASAAIGLFLTLFLPWYQETVIVKGRTTNLQAASVSVTGWGAFSFVEAAILLVAVGVLTLLFQRAEGRAFHLPGGDGNVITAAGLWTCGLIVWRIFDKQDATSNGQLASTSGIEWGIFIALAVAAFLAYSGSRIRVAHRPEPPLPGEEAAAGDPSPPRPPQAQPARQRRAETRPAAAAGSAAQPGASESDPDRAWEVGAAWEASGAWEAGSRRGSGAAREASAPRAAGLAREASARQEPAAAREAAARDAGAARESGASRGPDAAGTADAPRTQPLPRAQDQAHTEPLPDAPDQARTQPLPDASNRAQTEPLPGAPDSGRGGDAAPTRPRRRLADLPRPEPQDPPTWRVPPRARRSVRPSTPDQPAISSDEELTIPLEERRTED